MSKKAIFFISIIFILFFLGFLILKFWPKEKPEEENIEIPKDLKIDLRVYTLLGSYQKIQIKADGSVGPISTHRFKIRKTIKISKQKLKEIIDTFYENDFFLLKDRYEELPKEYLPGQDLPLGFHVTDAPKYELSFTANGKSHTVWANVGAGPESFYKIIYKLDSLLEEILGTPRSRNFKVELRSEKFIGENPEKTKENIKNFFQNLNSKIEIINIKDPNYHQQIIIWPIFPTDGSLKEDSIYSLSELEKDPWVLKVSVTSINNQKGWEIQFKRPLYISELQQFLDKYPRLKEKLFSPKLNDYYNIDVQIHIPEGTEVPYIKDLSLRYPSKVFSVKKILP